jgi:AcrR family transcriptional regulator
MSTRQQILRATERLIRKKGLSRVTTKQIAREVGFAEGTLFNHFRDKSDLFRTVLMENLPPLMEISTPDQAGLGTIEANLTKIALAAIRFFGKIVPLAGSLFADLELLSEHRAALRRCKGGPHHLFEHVAKYIAAEQRLGRIRQQVDPLGIAVLLLAPCFHWAFVRQANGQNLFKMTDTEFASLTVSTIGHAIKPEDDSTNQGQVHSNSGSSKGSTRS